MRALTNGHLFPISLSMNTLNPLPDLKKPSACIHVDHNMSGPAMRLYNCLLAYCQDEIPEIHDTPYLTIPRSVVMEYMRTRNDQAVKDWLQELSLSSVEFNNLGKGGLPSWGFYTFIQEPEFRGSYIRFGMAETLRGLIADSSMFAKINMLIERKFKKTKYALPLYELGLDYRDNRDRTTGKSCTPWMEVDKFRKYMGIKDSYPEFKLLNRAVIQPAIKEICVESDIIMKLEKEIDNRLVVRVRFTIESNTVNMSAVERLKRLHSTLPGLEGVKGVEAAYYADYMHKMFEVHLPRARKIARLYVGHRENFNSIAQKIERDKLEGRVKGKIGAYAARVFTDENPIVEIVKA